MKNTRIPTLSPLQDGLSILTSLLLEESFFLVVSELLGIIISKINLKRGAALGRASYLYP